MLSNAIMSQSRPTSLKRKRPSAHDYTVALIVPLSVELAPVRAMLDEIHDSLSTTRDYNFYTLGEIGPHKVIIVQLPSIGNNDSGPVANQLLNDFPNVRFGFLVGIGGGIPNLDNGVDVRLGDVVVCEAIGAGGAVIQLDRGRTFKDRFEHNGHLNKPHALLAAAAKTLRAKHAQEGNKLHHHFSEMLRKHPTMSNQYDCPPDGSDQLFQAIFEHAEESRSDCKLCDGSNAVMRPKRQDRKPHIFYGPVGSSNAVIKSATERDRLRDKFKILSVEMEAAGLMDILPCLAVRGICDYADSHKNKQWQPYAASMASAYVKELLLTIPPSVSVASVPAHLDSKNMSPQHLGHVCTQEFSCKQNPHSTGLIDSLAFDHLDDRQNNITHEHPATCKWLFQDTRFRSWINRDNINSDHGILWIKGKPGSGKSTIMKTALDWMTNTHKDEISLSYFFNARGSTELEKSSMGLYRSLSYQLLQKNRQLKDAFFNRFQMKCRNEIVEKWTLRELQNFLYEAFACLQDQGVNLFIDALDESEESDARALVDFLENLSLKAVYCSKPLRICLSSRHYPQISLNSAMTVIVEHHPGQQADLRTYISHKIGGLSSDTDFTDIEHKVFERSSGVFLWVALVVPLLKKAYDSGKESSLLRCFEHLPQDMDSLFEEIVSRGEEDIEQCHTLLQYVLCATRPFRTDELYFALQFTIDLQLSTKRPTESSMTRYLIQASRGLVEIKAGVVFLIHDLIRSFLIRRGTQRASGNNTVSFTGICHDNLKQTCFNYLLEAERLIGLNELAGLKVLDKKCHQAIKNDPFYQYAADNLLGHTEKALSNGIQQLEFLNRLTSNKTFRNWISANHKGPRLWPSSILGWCTLRGYENLVNTILSSDLALGVSQEEFLSALDMACTENHVEIVCMLLDAQIYAQSIRYNRLIFHATISGGKQILLMLILRAVEASADLELPESVSKTGGLLHRTCKFMCDISCIKALLDANVDVNVQGGLYHTALQAEVALYDREDVVHLLLDHGADVNIRGGEYGSALGAARARGRKNLEKILLDAGATS